MAGDQGHDGSPARGQWQRAISKVAASNAVPDPMDTVGDRFARVIKERTFLDSVNNEGAFLAAFGQRSLHNRLSSKNLKVDSGRDLETELEDLGSADGGAPSSSGAPGDDNSSETKAERVSRFVKVQRSMKGEGFAVSSAYSRNFEYDPNLEFKFSQFARTLLYELHPPGANWFAVIATEMLVFGHTFKEAKFCAAARGMLPPGFLIRLIPGTKGLFERYCKFFGAMEGMPFFFHLFFYFFGFWMYFPIFAVALNADVREYIEPLELLPMIILQLGRVFCLACKYALLPESYVNDRYGKIYRQMKIADMQRTLVGGGWNKSKEDAHFDMLKMELENACIQADVDLNSTEINVGSAQAAAAIRYRSHGIGEQPEKSRAKSSEVVSGKELLAALTDVHMGAPMPPHMEPGIMVFSIIFSLTAPIMRAWCGRPMFGATHLSKAASAFLMMYSWFIFANNMTFSASGAWHYKRHYNAILALNNMVRYPGERVVNFVPELPPAVKGKISPDQEPAELQQLRRAVAMDRELAVVVDLKDPASCLCWSLVRRSLRRVGSSWGRRMNAYSIIFLMMSFSSAGVLLLLYYGAEQINHRLATSGSFYVLSICISFLVCTTVIEAAAINEMVPRLRSWLKRETVAIAAQMAYLDVPKVRTDASRKEEEQLHSAHKLIESVEQYILVEEEQSDPVEVFFKVNATPAAVTFVVSSLLSMLLIAMQRGFTMMDSEGWSYNGPQGQFVRDPNVEL